MKRTFHLAALGLSLFAIAPVFAADGYVTGNVNLRAGPDTSYPSVVMLPAGAEVAIQGCVDGWSWCDVAAGNERGWVAGDFLQEEYQGQRVLVPEYGMQIGIPVVTFVFGTYWDDNYRHRSWYGNREHWSRITPHYEPASAHRGRHDGMREDTNPRSRNTSVDALRSHEQRAVAESRQHESTTTRPPQHEVAGEPRPPERNAHPARPASQHSVEPGAAVPKAVAVRKPAQPGTGVEHKAAHKPAAHKDAPEKKEDNGKDEHYDSSERRARRDKG
jgi:uncharacterized protein YraI